MIRSVKEKLDELGIRPSKGLGQNFLISELTYQKIIGAGDIKRGETVLEVGPGIGTLTEYLSDAGAKVVAVEKDRKLISFLEDSFAHSPNISIVEGDALEISPENYGIRADEYKVVANIPYYITSRLIRNIFEKWPRPKLIVLLLQREVAQRIIAKPPHLNLLAISVRYFADAKIMGKVPRNNFYPSPEVDSAIIRLTPLIQEIDRNFEKQFFHTARIGFSSKRKKLINNIANGFKLSKDELERMFMTARVDINARPENLTIELWKKLTETLHSHY